MRKFFLKAFGLVKTTYVISLGLTLICISGKAYGQLSSRVEDFSFTPCTEVFYTKDTLWRTEILHNNILSLNFTYEMPCSTYLYPEVLVITPDSMVMKIIPGNKKWDRDSKVPSKMISVSEENRGYYTFHINLSGVYTLPKEISINGKYHHSYFGFIDSDFYKTVRNKTFHNDSKNVSYEDIVALLGKSITDKDYKNFSGLLGNDYVQYDETHSFVEDNIRISYNSKNIINEIEVTTSYHGTLPGNILLSDPIDKVVKVLGNPDRKLPNNAVLLKENGEKVVFHDGDTYYYKKHKLSLQVNNNGSITFFRFK